MSVTLCTPQQIQHASNYTEWPVKDPACFEWRSYDKTTNTQLYKLNVSMFSKNEFHLFWTLRASENRLVARVLEYFTFHPLTPLTKKFNVTPLTCANFMIFWCSFPLTYKDQCVRAAKTFNFRIERKTWSMVGISEKTATAPAISYADDYKDRLRLFEQESESHPPINPHALCIPVKKQSSDIFCEFPQANNILWFKANVPMSEEEIDSREEETAVIGNALHKLGVD